MPLTHWCSLQYGNLCVCVCVSDNWSPQVFIRPRFHPIRNCNEMLNKKFYLFSNQVYVCVCVCATNLDHHSLPNSSTHKLELCSSNVSFLLLFCDLLVLLDSLFFALDTSVKWSFPLLFDAFCTADVHPQWVWLWTMFIIIEPLLLLLLLVWTFKSLKSSNCHLAKFLSIQCVCVKVPLDDQRAFDCKLCLSCFVCLNQLHSLDQHVYVFGFFYKLVSHFNCRLCRPLLSHKSIK